MSISVAHRCYFPGHDLRENRGNKSGMLGISWNILELYRLRYSIRVST